MEYETLTVEERRIALTKRLEFLERRHFECAMDIESTRAAEQPTETLIAQLATFEAAILRMREERTSIPERPTSD